LGQLPPPNHVSDGGSFRRKRPWYPHRHEHTTTIPTRRPNDPRQHARQWRAVARRVLLAVPPPGNPERRSVARSRAGADIRPAYGVHPLRNHRCRRSAELARATGAAERRWHCAMALSTESKILLETTDGWGCQDGKIPPLMRLCTRHPALDRQSQGPGLRGAIRRGGQLLKGQAHRVGTFTVR
jgi:hypothetical protein